jgi:hypothetical protein
MKTSFIGKAYSFFGIATIVGAGALGAIVTNGCGRPDDAELDASQRSNDYKPVDGLAAYGSQCPYGNVGDVKPLRLQMWNCPIGTNTIRLTEDIEPLYFQADCKTRILSVRTLDHKVDTSWYFLPDGEFDVVVDGVTAKLKSDGNGASNCNAPLAINLMGKVMCGPVGPTQDQATIKFQSVMWAGKKLNGQGANPMVVASPTPGLAPAPVPERVPITNQCNLPSSCYFFTQSELRQCQ